MINLVDQNQGREYSVISHAFHRVKLDSAMISAETKMRTITSMSIK